MKQLAPALKWISLRDTRKPLINRDPEQVATEQCDYIQALRKWSAIPLNDVQLVAHGLDEEHGQWQRALDWELLHLLRVHLQGERGCHWNIAFGNYNDVEAQRFKRLWDDADYLGPHAYIGWDSNRNQEAPREETCFRYRKWTGFPRHKCIPTESGFDDWAGTYHGDGKPGWRNLGINEETAKAKMLEIAREWHKDGLAGGIWYAKSTQNSEWESFYSTRNMETAWRALPPARLRVFDTGGGQVAITKDDLEKARLKIREEFLNVQKALGAKIEGNVEIVQRKAADQSLSAFNLSGKGANITDEQFAELAKKL